MVPLGLSGVTPNKVICPRFEKPLSEVNKTRKVKSDAQVATNKNSDHVQEVFS